ncbi:SDR family NAD(P)-dependent oxidoreductase [Hyphococcus luteus]|uniref:Dehydrogenase n=1 Tax=Hyphococcus luteus TaxID=2058213 RepID=A0A2S7K7B0_9PROT|nr:SDR family oxidoreductase [Marinicaulis flavus]PQA88366.1 dehydrogenase [Marinicaulis flavus]
MTYKNKWALVTGASAGIGATFARSYAAKGANIVLVARREERMRDLAAELEERHGVKTRIVAADLAEPDAPQRIYDALSADGIVVDILVNNAGFGLPGVYTENDWAAHRAYLELMLVSYAHMTRLFLPGMLARDYGRIIQVASLAGLVPGSAGHTLYGPSKAFLISFAQSIAAECDGTGVNSSAVCPGFTYSEFHDVNKTRGLVSQLPKHMFMEAEPVVEGAIDAVEKGRAVYVPGAWNKFTAWLARTLPRSWAEKMVTNQSKRFRKQTGH